MLVPQPPRTRDIDKVGRVLTDHLVEEYDGLETSALGLLQDGADPPLDRFFKVHD
jgi:hypothetical protein